MKRIFLLAVSYAFALPQHTEIVAGRADFVQTDPHSLQITASDQAILNYQTFSIERGENVSFIQPSSSSCILNRVIGQDRSSIYGSMTSNGRLFLVNPNGIYFSPEARVDTGSLIASTLDIQDPDFLSHQFRFSGGGAEIINQGRLTGDSVALLSPSIQNEGTLIANLDKVVLLSAETVTLNFSEDGLLRFALEGELENSHIENGGVIVGGEVYLQARKAENLIDSVINMDGIEMANALIEYGGEIELTDQSQIFGDSVFIEINGKVYGSGEVLAAGGKVQILGEEIQLKKATIDVSGEEGGGTVLIGGDFQGQGEIRTAKTTRVDEHSKIYADALGSGDGGKVIVWGDDQTWFDGSIFARGGEQGGKGGLVETSGKNGLNIQVGKVDASSPSGQFGIWLMDPTTITIANAGGGTLAQAADCTNTTTAVSISPATINAAAANVFLYATTSITQTNTVNITSGTVSINYVSPTVTLNASTTTAGGNISFYNGSAGGSCLIPTGTTSLLLNTGNITLTSNNGNISIAGSSNCSGTARNFTLAAGTGSISMGDVGTAAGGTFNTINFGGDGVTVGNIGTTGQSGAGTTTINSGTSILTFNGTNYNTTGNQTYTATGSPGFQIQGGPTTFTTSTNGVAIKFNTGNIELGMGNNLTVNTTTGAIAFNAIDGNISGNESLSITTTTGGITAGAAIGDNVALGSVSFTSTTGSLTLGDAITASSFTRTATGATGGITSFTGPITLIGPNGLTITQAGTGAISFPSTVGILSSAGPISIDNTGTLTLNTINISATGNFTQNGTGAITISGGTTSISASNNISFTSAVSGAANNGQGLILDAGGINTLGVIGATRLNNFTATGTVMAAGNITSTNMTFNNNVILTASGLTISSGANTGSLSFGGNLDGTTPNGQNVTITPGATSGTLTFSGAVGSSVPLGTLSMNGGLNAQSISATSITQTAGPGTNNYNGPLFASGAGTSIALNAATMNINFVGTAMSAPLGNITIVNSAPFTTVVGADISAGGSFAQTGGGNCSIGGDITAAGISFAHPTTLTNSSTTFTSTGANNISFAGAATLDGTTPGGQTVSLNAPLGAISLSTVGATTPLGPFSVTANTISINGNINTQNGLINMMGPITLNATTGFNSVNGGAGASINFSSTIDGANALTVTAGIGTVTFGGALGSITPLKGVAASGSLIDLNGNITNAPGATSLTGTVTLMTNVAIDNTDAGAHAAGGNITIAGDVISSTENLSLMGGTGGVVSISGNVALNQLTLNRSNSTSIGSSTTLTNVPTVAITDGGNVTFVAPVSISSNFTTTNTIGSLAYSVLFENGGIITTPGVTMFNNTSPNTFNSGLSPNLTFTNGVSSANNTTNILGTVATTASGAPMTYQAIAFAAGSSELITNSGAVNGTTVTSNGSSTNPITLDTTNGGAGSGASLDFTGNISGDNPYIITTGIGAATFGANIGTGGNPIASLSITSAGGISLGGNVNIAGGIANFAGPTTLTATIAISTADGVATGNNITFGTLTGAHALTLNAGTNGIVTQMGNINISSLTLTNASTYTFSPLLSTDLLTTSGALTISNTNSGSIILNTPLQLGNLSVPTSPASVTIANGGTIANTTTFGNTGGVILESGSFGSLTNTGFITSTASTTTILGNIVTMGTMTYGTVNFSDGDSSLSTSSNVVAVNGPIAMSGSGNTITITTTNAGVGNNINLNNTVDGSNTLDLTAGTGVINLSNTIGGITPLQNLNLSSGTINFNGNVGANSPGVTSALTASTSVGAINFAGTTYNANNQSYTANTTININGGMTTTFSSQSGPIAFNSEIVLSNGTPLVIITNNTSETLSNIQTASAGGANLTVFTGTGALSIGDIGNVSPLGVISLTGGSVNFTGPMAGTTLQINAFGNISNTNPSPLTFTGTANNSFNSTSSSIGSPFSPIDIIFPTSEGFAGSPIDAFFVGTTVDNTVHPIPNNPPLEIYFNGVLVFSNRTPPLPPPFNPALALLHSSAFTPALFFVAGAYSTSPYHSLGGDYIFLPDVLNDNSFKKKGDHLLFLKGYK